MGLCGVIAQNGDLIDAEVARDALETVLQQLVDSGAELRATHQILIFPC